ncbi:MAG TPA: magnesium/cobalt efflux protein [Gammaproteobacteria bacterium]|jgi:magnesium and cobalt transporter|nr:magnesium/cobalt efflux protein [Gammaproteobacteria bacterium]
MHDDHPPGSNQLSWLERLGKSLSGEPANRDQLIETLRSAEQREILDSTALSMIEGALQVADMQARDIMIPRSQMETITDQSSLEEMMDIITKSGHSRFPVISDKKDTVMGILLAKDLLRYLKPSETAKFVLEDVLRTPVIVPQSKRLNVLLNDFRNTRNHMAIIVDEYSDVAGLVTIEDVLEQIVGEIDDEFDIEEVDNAILNKGDNVYAIKALTPLEDFNAYFKADLNADLDTIGGLIAKQLGRMPKAGESVNIQGYQFTIRKADSRRVHLLEMVADSPSAATG